MSRAAKGRGHRKRQNTLCTERCFFFSCASGWHKEKVPRAQERQTPLYLFSEWLRDGEVEHMRLHQKSRLTRAGYGSSGGEIEGWMGCGCEDGSNRHDTPGDQVRCVLQFERHLRVGPNVADPYSVTLGPRMKYLSSRCAVVAACTCDVPGSVARSACLRNVCILDARAALRGPATTTRTCLLRSAGGSGSPTKT